MVSKRVISESKDHRENMAILALILNIIILPGIGSLVGGKVREGVWQIALFIGGFLIGLLFTLTIIGAVVGIPLMFFAPIAAWVWALFTGIKLVKDVK